MFTLQLFTNFLFLHAHYEHCLSKSDVSRVLPVTCEITVNASTMSTFTIQVSVMNILQKLKCMAFAVCDLYDILVCGLYGIHMV